MRKARKEAFKSASVVLKLQETLRDTQKRLQVSKIDHATDVQKADRFEQEATDAKCALMAMQQDLGKLQEQFRVLEQEKEALKTSLKEEEVARIAAEGQIALPAAQEDDDDLLNTPRKSLSPRKLQRMLSDDKENVGIVTKKMVESKKMQQELDAEKQKREAAEEMVEFMRMECAFKCCGCTSTAKHGREMRVSMDEILASSIQKMKSDIASILTPPASEKDDDEMEVEIASTEPDIVHTAPSSDAEEAQNKTTDDATMAEPHDIALPEGDHSMTVLADEPSETASKEISPMLPASTTHNDHTLDQELVQDNVDAAIEEEVDGNEHLQEVSRPAVTVPLKDSPPSTPNRKQQDDEQHQHSVRTITTTTRIPMHFTPVSKPSLSASWGQHSQPSQVDGSADCAVDDAPPALPFDREAALAAIAYRRGRAKSIADGTYTPRKQMVDLQRRDISAPVIGNKEYVPKPRSMSSRSGKKMHV